LEDLTSGYQFPRDVHRISNGFKNNEAIPHPIVIKKNGKHTVMSGNTRMDAAFIHGINPHVALIDLDEKTTQKAEWKDKISGGLADDKKPEAAGKEVEREHTSDPHVAQEIAADHLSEDKNYYLKLKTIEKSNSIKPFGQNIYDSTANLGRKMGRTGDTVEGAGPNTAVQQSSKNPFGSMKQQVSLEDKKLKRINRKQPVKQLSAADANAYFQKLLSSGRIKKA
jgi:hypothetical protein